MLTGQQCGEEERGGTANTAAPTSKVGPRRDAIGPTFFNCIQEQEVYRPAPPAPSFEEGRRSERHRQSQRRRIEGLPDRPRADRQPDGPQQCAGAVKNMARQMDPRDNNAPPALVKSHGTAPAERIAHKMRAQHNGNAAPRTRFARSCGRRRGALTRLHGGQATVRGALPARPAV